MNQRDTVASKPAAREDRSIPVNANATKRGPVGELLDHLLSELRQLDHRCAQLEILLHDLTIRYATTDADPLRTNERP